MKHEGILTVVSGFSGAGKGTVMKRLMELYGGQYALSVSATSRAPRPGEVDGREYFFKTEEEFEQMIREDQLIEHARYVNHYYGTPAEYVFSQMKAGKDVILEIETQGALQVKKKYPDTLLVFVTPPTAKELKERLLGRGTEAEEVIAMRLSQAAQEALLMPEYDYIVVNETGKVDACAEEIHRLIQSQHGQSARNREFIEAIREDLRTFII